MADSLNGSGPLLSDYLQPFAGKMQDVATFVQAATKTADTELQEKLRILKAQTDASHLLGALGGRIEQLADLGDSSAAIISDASQRLADYVVRLKAARL